MDQILRCNTEEIKATLMYLGFHNQIGVQDQVVSASSELSDELTYGVVGINFTNVAQLISSEGSEYDNKQIKLILIPYTLGGTIQTNGTTAYTNYGYVFDQGRVNLVTGQIPLDMISVADEFRLGRNVDAEQLLEQYGAVEHLLLENPKIIHVSSDKLRTKRVFEKHGVRTPIYLELRSSDDLEGTIRRFQEENNCTDFVVKATHGRGGNQVKLYDKEDVVAAVEYVRELHAEGKKVFVEERLKPKEWRDEKGRILDWNIRTLMGIGKEPVFIDWLVRYQPRSNDPVNVAIKAKGALLEDFADIAGISLRDVEEHCRGIASAVYNALGDNDIVGLISLDTMVTEEGIFSYEINASAGGFYRIVKMRGHPIRNFPNFLRSCGPKLVRGHAQRTSDNLKALPTTRTGNFNLGSTLNFLERPEEARLYFKRLREMDPNLRI